MEIIEDRGDLKLRFGGIEAGTTYTSPIYHFDKITREDALSLIEYIAKKKGIEIKWLAKITKIEEIEDKTKEE